MATASPEIWSNIQEVIEVAAKIRRELYLRGALPKTLARRQRALKHARELAGADIFTLAPHDRMETRRTVLRSAQIHFASVTPPPKLYSDSLAATDPPSSPPPCKLGEFLFVIPPTQYFCQLQPYTPSPMERRRGALPVGNNSQNSVPQYQQLNLQQQQSFGSTDSADSNDSFRTQIPLPYHLPQGYQQSNSYAVSGGFAPYAQTGSNGSPTSLNPTSSPYIPQGNTPTLPSAAFAGQGWGVPQASIASAYQQQQPDQQSGAMQYQGGNPYQQHSGAQFGGAANAMNPQLQNTFDNGVGPYAHFGPAFAASNSVNQYNTADGQMGFTSFATPDPVYATAMSPYGVGVVNQPANTMYSGSASNMYENANMYSNQMPGSMSFPAPSGNAYIGQNTPATSFHSAPGKMNNNQTPGSNLKNGSQNQKSSRPASSQSNASTMRFQMKSFAPSDGKERQNSSRGSVHQRSTSTTPFAGGPVQAPQSGRGNSPEKLVSKSTTPESSRTRKNKGNAVEDTTAIPTPVSNPFPPDAGLFSTLARTESKTPQLRSRRGQTIASATNTAQKMAVTDWAVGVRRLSEVGVMSSEELRGRGSPVNALSLLTLNDTDPFISSAVASSGLFNCMTPGRFTVGFGSGPLSQELLNLTQGGTQDPALADALDPYNLPFSEYCRQAKSDNYGVIKIRNIPYSTTRAEVLAFLGRNARLVNESEYEPIHIIMERVTSKTLDCFVEFIDLGEAVSAVNRFEGNRQGGRGRLGQRHVDVELSTQGELMKELFPKAKNVQWDGSRPHIVPRDPNDMYNSGFQGFIIKEELIMLLKHVEAPQRTPFSKDCPQRSFECLISTLVKYPWYMVDYITIEDRNILHHTTKKMLEILVERVNNNDDSVNLNGMLLKRVWRAALTCPGFTPSMKDDIVCIAGLDDRTAVDCGLAPHASFWNKLWTIGPKPEAPVDVLLWYIAKIRQACATTQQLSLAEQAEKGTQRKEEKLFGDLDKYINYGPGLNGMTLAHVAKIEWAAIENALRRAFTPALPAPN